MDELSRYLFIGGAMPFLLLGVAHAFATPLSIGTRKGLSPKDPALTEKMAASTICLTSRTNVWLAWVGFNLSHSLGAVLFGVVVLLIGRSPTSFASQGAAFGALAVAVSALYLVLAVFYWFRTPIMGCVIAFTLFAISWLLALLG